MDANLKKNEFVAMLAHELRNPLAPILTALAVMKNCLSRGRDSSFEHFCNLIERNVKDMSRKIDGLLDASRILNGKITLHHEVVSFRNVIENSIESVKPLATQKEHRLIIELPFARTMVIGDFTRLVQIFVSLLLNAVRFTPHRGEIKITCQLDGEKVITTVADNGQGIPKETMPLIWDLFNQGERDLDRSQGGLGIGLTLAKELVELHHGNIGAHSDGCGKGSAFVVTLPTVSGTLSSKREANKRRTAMKPLHILIVDDNSDVVDTLRVYLELSGHNIQIAYDGPEALDKCKAADYDAILLDIGLPTINGYEVCRRLREDGNNSFIVAITGYGQEEDKQKSKEVGFNRHLVKPVDPSVLDECLMQLTDLPSF